MLLFNIVTLPSDLIAWIVLDIVQLSNINSPPALTIIAGLYSQSLKNPGLLSITIFFNVSFCPALIVTKYWFALFGIILWLFPYIVVFPSDNVNCPEVSLVKLNVPLVFIWFKLETFLYGSSIFFKLNVLSFMLLVTFGLIFTSFDTVFLS